jgi:hypothetical protein
MPKLLLLILLAAPGIAIAQSPFDGAWRIDPASFKVPEAPTQFLLANGSVSMPGLLGGCRHQG